MQQSEDVGHMHGFMPLLKTHLEKNNVLCVSKVNDETRNNNPDEVSELSVPETHFDRQTHTHHKTFAFPVISIAMQRTESMQLISKEF